jgi:hypothetical protein
VLILSSGKIIVAGTIVNTDWEDNEHSGIGNARLTSAGSLSRQQSASAAIVPPHDHRDNFAGGFAFAVYHPGTTLLAAVGSVTIRETRSSIGGTWSSGPSSIDVDADAVGVEFQHWIMMLAQSIATSVKAVCP